MAAGCFWKKVPIGTPTDCLTHLEIFSNQVKPTGEKRSVIQMDENGNVIKIFESVTAASKEIGVNAKSIRLCAKGAQRYAGGFCWKYND